MEVERGRGRHDFLEEDRRIEKDRVGIGQERLAAGGGAVDEGGVSGRQHRHRDPAPRPVRHVGIPEDEAARAHDFGEKGQGEEDRDGEAGEDAPARHGPIVSSTLHLEP